MDDPGVISASEKRQLIIEAIQEKKGHRIVSIDLTEVDHAICDSFIVCHGESTTQVSAIADSIERKLKTDARIRPHHVEGAQNCQWILIDYFEILVHVFLEDFRDFYKLEELWADGKVLAFKENEEK